VAGLGDTKGGSVPQQPAQRGIRTGQAVGLAVFLVSAIFLGAIFVTGLGTSLDSLQRTAVSLSTLSAAVAASAMLVDGVDLWVRGRRLSPSGVRIVRSLIFVAVLVALLTSLVGGNSLMVLILAPSMVVYLFMARRSPTGSYAAATARGGSRSGGVPSRSSRTGSSTSKSRQRKGGKKHR
jgi:hypothetical protein